MTFTGAFVAASSIAKLVLAVWLFSRTLPQREPAGVRTALVLAAVAVVAGVAVTLGFSMYPTLTDDLSLLVGILTLVGELAVAVFMQRLVYDCPLWTSVFCCSMAYSLENLSSAVERTFGGLWPMASYPPPLLEGAARFWLFSLLVYAAVYLVFVRRVEKNGLLQIDDPVMVLVTALVIVVNMVLDVVVKDVCVPSLGVPGYDANTLGTVYLLLCVYIMYSVFEIVYNRRLQLNMAAIERLRATEARQYQMSRENIEAINIKCHDLKHQIRALASGGASVDGRVLDEISREVGVYDSVVKSGNDALDTILTEKSLYCEKHGITLFCIADGRALDFVEPTDLYSFFGNALDNAIEAVERLDDPERRSIGLVVRRTGDMVSVHVENYFDGQVSFGGEGLPQTRKADEANHGFGTRSMRMIAEGLGGSLACKIQGDVFHLDALLPVPEG